MNKVIAYIDGHNLFNGILEAEWPQKYLWLDVCGLIESILAINQELVIVKFFTALQDNEKPKTLRLQAYIDALEMLFYCKVIKGKYKLEDNYCPRCNRKFTEYKEKMTDVNIAIEILRDTYSNNFDIAMILSADSDFVPVAEAIKEKSPDKRIVAVFPPKRTSDDLKGVVDAWFRIGRANIAQNPLPNTIKREDGTYITRPPEWT